MSEGLKRPVGEVLIALEWLLKVLGPVCTRIAVAGSIRRGEALVGDIEIVCQPVGTRVDVLCDDLVRRGLVRKRHKSNGHLLAWGTRYKAMAVPHPLSLAPAHGEGMVGVDLFCVLKDRQWGPTYLLRTGPGSANECLVTTEGIVNSNGHKGILPRGMAFRDGAVYRGEVRLETPEERDVFAAVGLPYVPPPLRSYTLYRALYRGEPMPVFHPGWLDGRDDFWLAGARKVVTTPVAVETDVPEMVQGRLF